MPNVQKIKAVLDDRENNLLEAILKAGEILKSYWPNNPDQKADFTVEIKKDGSQVTTADFMSNEILLEALQRNYPSDLICSEEVPYVHQENNPRVWYVDPLDGTKHFVDGLDDFSILVGLCENGIPTIGFIYFPILDVLGFSAKGRGVFGNEEEIKVSKNTIIDPEKIYVRRFEPKTGKGYKNFDTIDSGNAQYMVASGTLDACIAKLVSHKAWDFVATSAMIINAGGLVTDEYGNNIKFIGSDMTSDFYVASNGLVHQEILDLIKNN